MSENIRVGLIGYGYASKTFHAPLVAGTPGMELAAITSSDETKVHADWPAVPVDGGVVSCRSFTTCFFFFFF